MATATGTSEANGVGGGRGGAVPGVGVDVHPWDTW